MAPRVYKESLSIGDVIRTHPHESFWGCAIVLATWPQNEVVGPTCHIGVTDTLFKHEFSWSEVNEADFRIMDFERAYRTTRDDIRVRREVCIGQYANFGKMPLPIIASIDPTNIWSASLNQDIGYGTNSAYPIYGKISERLGSEAVIKWRRIHESEAFEADAILSEEETFRLLRDLKQGNL